jgi:4a-hydroxytetrahydrobiopterin dehydratase
MAVDWKYSADRRALVAKVKTRDFMSALRLIGKIAKLAEKMDHHPDLHLTGYRNLKIVLSTHSEGRVTAKDRQLAKKISALAPPPRTPSQGGALGFD